MSQASDTDVRLFLQLANPNVTASPQDAIYEEDDDEEAPPLEGGGEEEYEEDEYEDENNPGGDDPRGPPSGGRFEEAEEEEGYEEDEDVEEAGERHREMIAAPIEMDAATLEVEKQSALLEIERLKAQGVKITKDYTLDDDLTVIQWEIRKQLMLIDEGNSISFMKDAMRLGFSGIEALNGKVKLLELEGWAGQASSEMAGHKYDNALSKIYRKYWRRGSSSPEMEIAFGILGSMGSYHFKKKLMGSRPPPIRPRSGAPILDDSDDEEVPP